MTKKKQKSFVKKMQKYARGCYVNFSEKKKKNEKEYPGVRYRNMSKNINKNSKESEKKLLFCA